MIEYIGAIQEFLTKYQLLVFSVVIPLLSGIIAFFSSMYASNRAVRISRAQRQFQSSMKLADFRQKWIDDMRDDISEFSSLCFILPDTEEKTEMYRRISMLADRIRMRMNPKDKDYNALSNAIHHEIHNATLKEDEDLIDLPNRSPIVGRQILKREWERLKADLVTSK